MSKNRKKTILLSARIPEEVYLQMFLLRPELMDHNGARKYKAVPDYLVALIREDLRNVLEGGQTHVQAEDGGGEEVQEESEELGAVAKGKIPKANEERLEA